jgi:hypothetical protein
MKLISLAIAMFLGCSLLLGQTHPVPFVNSPLAPASADLGGAAFELAVNGTGFVSGAVVEWDGKARTTSFVSSSQLTAKILAADIASAGTAAVTVVNPPPGGGKSNVVLCPVTLATSLAGFATFASYSLSSNSIATAIVAGDLNGDGIPDLAIANWYEVTVLLGNGNGTFQAPVNYSVSSPTESIVIGDFNGDGIPDLALDSCCSGIFVLLGKGDGTFLPSTSYFTDANNYDNGITAGDLNGDGKLDIAAAVDLDVVVLLNQGNNQFSSADLYLRRYVDGIATGDFNGDGLLDLAAVGLGGVYIGLNKGKGEFDSFTQIGGDFFSVAAADFNGDGILDLAAGGPTGIAVFRGKGDGTFTRTGTLTPSANGEIGLGGAVVTGDFNGDGIVDLAVGVGANGSDGIAVFLGKGDGTFQPPQITAGQQNLISVAVADFNGDGRLDIATLFQGSVSINLQTTTIVSPGVLVFPPTIVNTKSQVETVTFTNSANAPVAISAVTLTGSEFSILNDTCQGVTVPGLGTCTVDLTFTPTQTGAQTAVLTFTDNAFVSSQTVAIEGNGTVIRVSPAKLNFGDVAVGGISPAQVVTVTNTGATAVDFLSIALTGDSTAFLMSSGCGAYLNPKASCSLAIQFVPPEAGAATSRISISLQEGTGTGPKEAILSGTGT